MVMVVVPYMRTPLATTWSGSKSSLNRSPRCFGVTRSPVSPGPPWNLGGEDPPPKFRGLRVPNPLLYSVFEGCPLNLGVVNLHTLKLSLGGMGLQGGRICSDWLRFLSLFLHSLFPGICSGLLRFLFRFVFSTQIRTNQGNPFCWPLFRVTDSISHLSFPHAPFTSVLGYCFFSFYSAGLACNESASSQSSHKSLENSGAWLTTRYKLSFAFMDSCRHMTLRSQQHCTCTKHMYSPQEIHVEDLSAEPARQQGYPQSNQRIPLAVCQGSLNQVRITSQLLCGML